MTSLKRKAFAEDHSEKSDIEDSNADKRKPKKQKTNHKNKSSSFRGLVSHWSKDFIGKLLGKKTENKRKEKQSCSSTLDEINMDNSKNNQLCGADKNKDFFKSSVVKLQTNFSDRRKVEYLNNVYQNDLEDKINNSEIQSSGSVSLTELKSMALQCQYSDGDASFKKLKQNSHLSEPDESESNFVSKKKNRTFDAKPVTMANRKMKARTQSLTDCRSSFTKKDGYSCDKVTSPSKTSKPKMHRYKSQTVVSNKYKSDDSSFNSSSDSVFSSSSTEYEDEKYTFFWRKYSPFSQHHACSFVVRGTKYNCAEQYMMEQKAEMFGDKVMVAKIMATADPALQKKYGRMVANFNNTVWQSKCKDVVKEANIAKFSQNKHLLRALYATQGTTLVEASPVDRLWGIGLAADDPRAQCKAKWRGKNWLGYCLTEVREMLRESAST